VLNNSEQLIAQIEDLRKKLETANRGDGRRIQQQITDLEVEIESNCLDSSSASLASPSACTKYCEVCDC